MKKYKITYIVGGNYAANGMSMVLSQKINYLAENADYELNMVLTERSDLPFHYPISDKVKYINFNINFDELDTLPIIQKLIAYRKKVKKYKMLLTEYLMETKPDITVSTLRRELNFINQIKDGSRKIGEIHFNKNNYRKFSEPFLPERINKAITRRWQKKLIEELKKLKKFIVLSKEDQENWKELELAEKNCFLIEHKEKRKQMRKKARESSIRFTQELIMKQWTELFNSIIKNNDIK